MSPTARAEIVVDLAAIRHNVRVLRELVPLTTSVQLIAIVKADGYGHGMLEAGPGRPRGRRRVARRRHPRRGARAPRGRRRRPRCCAGSACPARTTRPRIAADVDLTAYSVAELDEIAAVAAGRRPGSSSRSTPASPVAAHRRPGPTSSPRREAGETEGSWTVTGIWSHFACSDEPDHPANDAQEAAFTEALAIADADRPAPRGPPPRQLRRRDPAAELPLRPGALRHRVYGLDPAPGVTDDLGLGRR